MMKRPCTSDLAVRERRGQLTPNEQRSLEAHVVACESCRVVREIGGSFDAPETPELDDGARIQRLARAAETWSKRGRVPRRRTPASILRRRGLMLLAACIVLCCGVAAAALGRRPWLRASVFGSSESRTAETSKTPATMRPSAVDSPPKAEEPPAATQGEPPGPPAPRPRHADHGASAPDDTPSALFRAANDARRRSDAKGAVALYRKLQRQFPTSPESDLSAIPLGMLLLDGHSPKEAYEQFDRAAVVLGGAFRPEALYGRARALAAMGDEAGERRSWQQLVDEFPACPYAESARRRLASTPWTAPSASR
jgi:TolA-binding protein